MYIRNTANDTSPVRQLRTAQMDEPVEFNDDGVARVTAEVGEHLVSQFDYIEVEREEGNGGLGGGTDETTETTETDDDTASEADLDAPDATDASLDTADSVDNDDDTELQPTADETVDETEETD